MYTETDTGSGINIKNYDFVDGTETHGGILLHWFSAVDRNFYNAGSNKVVSTYDYSNLVAGHEYELIFNTYLNIMSDYTIVVKLGLGNVVFEQKIPKSGYVQKVTAKFVAPDVVTNSTRLTIELTCDSNQSYGSNSQDMQVKYMISEKVELTDLTENPSWLGKILQKFIDLGDSIGGFIDSLKQSISDWFANVGEWFEEQKQKIQDFSDSVGQWFEDLKLKIENTFQAAVDEIKSWFIPSDGFMEKYNDKWLNWCEEHFGVLVQFPEILVDLVHRLSDVMSPNSYAFTFPEISVPIAGRTYVFVEEQTVDMSFWLNGQTTTKYLYDVYTLCVYAIFIFALFKYIQHIDEKIMLKG